MSPTEAEKAEHPVRDFIAKVFTLIEDVSYLGLGLLLGSIALSLLAMSAYRVVHSVAAGGLAKDVVELLDQILLILLIVEIMYTVQVSFREHTILPGPFLLVGLIAAIRRVLLLTAQFGEAQNRSPAELQWFLIELGVLTALILVLVVSIRLLHKTTSGAGEAKRG